jgi:hypothetical protein
MTEENSRNWAEIIGKSDPARGLAALKMLADGVDPETIIRTVYPEYFGDIEEESNEHEAGGQ